MTLRLCKPYKECSLFQISQGFYGFHTAVDFAYKYGTWLVAPENCVVDVVIDNSNWDRSYNRGYGIRLQSSSNPNNKYLFWHCLPYFPVKVGDIVLQGQPVAQMGNSGDVRVGNEWISEESKVRLKFPYPGTHVHFEMLLEGVPVDPIKFINWGILVSYDLLTTIKSILFNIKLALQRFPISIIKGRK